MRKDWGGKSAVNHEDDVLARRAPLRLPEASSPSMPAALVKRTNAAAHAPDAPLQDEALFRSFRGFRVILPFLMLP